MNRGAIANLALLKTLLAISQKFWEPNLWEVMDSFVLLAYGSLAASKTLMQQLLACLNSVLDSEDLFCWYKPKSAFYELCQWHKQLKTMEMSETWLVQWGIYTSIPTWTHLLSLGDKLIFGNLKKTNKTNHQMVCNFKIYT